MTKNQNPVCLLLLVFLMNVGPDVFGQSQFEKENKPGYSRCGETVYALVKKKDKTGLYNLAEDAFVLKPTINFYYFAESLNYLFEAYPDGRIFLYNLEKETGAGEILSPCMSAENALLLNNYQSGFDESAVRLVSGSIGHITETANGVVVDGILGGVPGYDATTMEAGCTRNSKTSSVGHSTFSIGVEVRKNFVIVSDYFSEGEAQHQPLKSLEYPDEDSLDGSGQQVFPRPPVNTMRSGVFNTSTKTWSIPQLYQKVYSVNDLLICLAQDRAGEHYYDVYFFHPHGHIESTAFKNIRRNRDFPHYLLFNEWQKDEVLSDSIVFDEKNLRYYKHDVDSSYFYISHNKTHLQGMMHFQLFDETMNVDYATNKGPAQFEIDTIFEPVYEFVVKTGVEQPYFFAYAEGRFSAITRGGAFIRFPLTWTDYFFTNGHGSYFADNRFYYDTCYNQSICLAMRDGVAAEPKISDYGIKMWDDSLIYVNHFVTKSNGDYTPIPSLIYPGEDSMSRDGNVVYNQTYNVRASSGVYDLKSKSWIFDRKYAWIVPSYNGFLLCEPLIGENGTLREYVFSFKTAEGEYIFKNVSEPAFYENNSYLKFILNEYDADTLYQVSGDLPYLRYFEVNGRTGLYDVKGQYVLSDPSELLFYNEEFNFIFTIDNGQMNVLGRNLEKTIPVNADTDISYYLESLGYKGEHDLFLFDLSGDTNELAHYSVYEGQFFFSEHADDEIAEKMNHAVIKSPEVFRVKGINDSLVYIENRSTDQLFGEIVTPEIYFDRFGSFENAPLPDFAYGRSGVYNLKTGKWFIAPRYISVIAAPNGNFIAASPVLDKSGFTISSVFSVIDASGNVVVNKTPFKKLSAEYQKLIGQ